MRSKVYIFPLLLLFIGFFIFSVSLGKGKNVSIPMNTVADSRVVISAPILIMLFAGDRYLAANFETIRLSATGVDDGQADTNYLMRSQYEISLLNSCHLDNYYIANGLLTWGGADKEGREVIRRASDCRFWDELPPFFYGFSEYFFYRNIPRAAHYLELAAQRATNNAAGFRKFALMLKAEQINDVALAVQFLREEHAKVADPKLKEMLSKRISRLEGLSLLRNAQSRYEQEFGQKLQDPQALLDTGYLAEVPHDPLGLGYLFVDGHFILKSLKIAGMEE